ncbi:MAG: ribonuclease Z [Flavobacteriaceae bacterium]|nr:MAG: ribonuclease Z [Flavobacteriaceae bacterium]
MSHPTLTILGFNSALPTTNSHPTAQLLEMAGHTFLIDCGEATQVQIRKTGTKFSKIRHIFISHLHGDHVFGLIGLISSLQLMKTTPSLHIYGPKGIRDFIENQLKHTKSEGNFPIHFVELTSTQNEVIFEDEKIVVETIPLVHRIYTNGYFFKEKQKERSLVMEEIQKYPEIEICDYQNLKNGKDFVLSSGEILPNTLLTKDGPSPKSYAFCSDTRYKPKVCEQILGADLLYHEATFLHELEEKAYATGHSTALQAAMIARDAKVKKLIIGHFSTRYFPHYHRLQEEAQTVFPETCLPELLEKVQF